MDIINLKLLRKQNNKTQAEIAKLLSITSAGYNNYEKKKTEPSIDILVKLADYYNVTLDYLVGREFNNEFGYLNDKEKELVSMFRQMNNDNQLTLFAEAKGILISQK